MDEFTKNLAAGVYYPPGLAATLTSLYGALRMLSKNLIYTGGPGRKKYRRYAEFFEIFEISINLPTSKAEYVKKFRLFRSTYLC